MHGHKVPRNAKEVMDFDRKNGNSKWGNATGKEIEVMIKYDFFKFLSRDVTLNYDEGW